MSVAAAAAAGGGDGNGGGDDEKKKGMLEITDSSSSTSSVEVTDEEVEFERVDLSNYEAERRLDFLRITRSLEANLPVKRSLSTNYQGKSKSFGNLAELGTEEAKDLEKKEHPLNKRRRLLMAHEIRDKELSGEATNSNITHASSLPVLPKNEDYDADKDEDDDKKKASDHDEDEDDDDDDGN